MCSSSPSRFRSLIAVVLGFVPVFHASRRQLQYDLQDAGRGTSAGARQTRVRNVLIVAQVALTLMLLVGAGLLGRSFQRLLAVDPGFAPESVVAMTVLLPQRGRTSRRCVRSHNSIIAFSSASQSLPGVTEVGGTSALPMSGNGANGTFIEARGGKTAETMQELSRQFDALSPERARTRCRLSRGQRRLLRCDGHSADPRPALPGKRRAGCAARRA